MARVLSVNVGLPRDIEWRGRTVHTGIWKNPVLGRCRVGRLNLDGDGQGDLAGHGGEQRAVFVYQIESYRHWQEQMKRTDFVHGQFGENFTIEGLPDDAVCIGDRYQIATRTASQSWRSLNVMTTAAESARPAFGVAWLRAEKPLDVRFGSTAKLGGSKDLVRFAPKNRLRWPNRELSKFAAVGWLT